MYCTKCGMEISDEAHVCELCGNIVSSQSACIDNSTQEMQSTRDEGSSEAKNDLKDTLSAYLGLIGSILMILFLLGFLDQPISMLLKAIGRCLL